MSRREARGGGGGMVMEKASQTEGTAHAKAWRRKAV